MLMGAGGVNQRVGSVTQRQTGRMPQESTASILMVNGARAVALAWAQDGGDLTVEPTATLAVGSAGTDATAGVGGMPCVRAGGGAPPIPAATPVREATTGTSIGMALLPDDRDDPDEPVPQAFLRRAPVRHNYSCGPLRNPTTQDLT